MVQKVVATALRLLEIARKWPGLLAASRLGVTPPAQTSPVLKMDLFFESQVPDWSVREAAFSEGLFWETSLGRSKDRFFWDGLPVHLEYKLRFEVESLLDSVTDPAQNRGQESTYGLFRLAHGIVLEDSQKWLSSVRSRLESVPAAFWGFQIRNLNQRLEHTVTDLTAAIFESDNLGYHLALSRYLESVVELLFAHNRRFLCPVEDLGGALEEMEIKPSGWSGLWDSLVRESTVLDHERKVEIARVLAQLLLKLP